MSEWPKRYRDLSRLHLAELRLACSVNALYPRLSVPDDEFVPAKILAGYHAWQAQHQQTRTA